MQISIKIVNLNNIKNILVDTDRDVFLLGAKQLKTDTMLFANRLLGIISSWKKNMINPFIIDGESYEIIIQDEPEKLKYVGKNYFPSNYYKFKNLISEIENQ